MLNISKEFHFSAAHQLSGLEKNHPCSRVHGHNYKLTVFLKGEVNEIGFIQDYKELEPIKKFIDDNMEHQFLNEFFMFNPTVENICVYLFDIFKEKFPLLYALELSETDKTNCRYEPN